MTSYCSKFNNDLLDPIHKKYHNSVYGFPESDDNKLFEKLSLEINQAGLSWDIILKKYTELKKAYSGFNIIKVAAYKSDQINELLNNKKIIRNKLKIYSIVYNAKAILKIQKDHKSFKSWLDKKKCKNINQWVKLFKKKFKFIGIKITEEFLLSSGYIEGAHNKECKIYNEILKSNPNWLKK